MYFPEIEWFFGALFLYSISYLIVDYESKSNESYTILSLDRKNYYKKNIVKSVALTAISIYGSFILFNGFVFNRWNNIEMYRVGYLYSALDVLGLVKVKNLPNNSRIHHITTFILSYINTLIDYSNPSFWVGLPVYCILSCYACGVNYFLGTRLLKPLSELITLIKINIISYSFLLGINWIYQIYNVYKNFENSGYDMYIYIGLLLFVANDDVKLVKFLMHQLKKARKDELEYVRNL